MLNNECLWDSLPKKRLYGLREVLQFGNPQ